MQVNAQFIVHYGALVRALLLVVIAIRIMPVFCMQLGVSHEQVQDGQAVYQLHENSDDERDLYLSHEDLTLLPDISQIQVRNSAAPETSNITEIADLTLILEEAKLREFPRGFNVLTNLVGLNMNYNEISSIPSSVTELKQLGRFLIAHNLLSEFPFQLFFNVHLTSLNLRNNKLTSIDPAIKKLGLLRHLSFEGNRISAVPRELFELVFLRFLGLGDNLLRELPPELGNLRELETLRVCNNTHLKHLPSTATLLTNLRDLAIHNTGFANRGVLSALTLLNTLSIGGVGPLDELLQVLHVLPNMSDLDVAWNALRGEIVGGNVLDLTVSHKVLTNCEKFPQNLTTLDLRYNRLLRIPTTILACNTLCYLDLSGNCIEAIPPELSSLTHLERLFLSDNALSVLPDSFSHFTSLKVLRLNVNQIEELPTNLCNLTSLEDFDVMHNPCGLLIHSKQAASVGMILYMLAGKRCVNTSRSLFKCVDGSEDLALQNIKRLLENVKRSLHEQLCSPIKIPDFLLEHDCIMILKDCIPVLKEQERKLSQFLQQGEWAYMASTFLRLSPTLAQMRDALQTERELHLESLQHAITLYEYLMFYQWLRRLFVSHGFGCGNPLDVIPWCFLPKPLKVMILRRSFD